MNELEKKQLMERLYSMAKEEIRISYQKETTSIPFLSSKIGGKPAVPADFVWPQYTGIAYGEKESKSRPLSFMAQINLKDVAQFDEEHLLPKSGILSFFYELETMTWGFDPKDKGSARVFYFPNESELILTDYPTEMEEYVKIPEYAIHFEKQISIPEYMELKNNDQYDWDDYQECRIECGYAPDKWGTYMKLLGYPDIIQSAMQEECEMATRGYRQGNPEDDVKISEEEKRDIQSNADEWILLFQMGTITDDDYELMFGDCGHIYYWIKKKDLLDCNFENIWLVLQCS